MVALAAVTDVQARLPASMTIETVRTNALLGDASAVVRSYAKTQFTQTSVTAKTRPVGDRIKLKRRPVISVQSLALVLTNGAAPAPFPGWFWDGSDEVWLLAGPAVINLAEEMLLALNDRTPIVFVTYTYGYTVIPDDVVGVVCSMVIRTLTAPGLGGVVSEGVGEYTYRLSDAAAQGPMALTQAEKDILASYRPKNNQAIELRM